MLKTKIRVWLGVAMLLSAWGCEDNSDFQKSDKERSMRDVDVAEIPEVVSALNGQLGLSRGEAAIFSIYGQNSQSNVEIDWDRIVELIDTVGNVNYTFGIKDPENGPYVFHNLIIGKNQFGQFKQPYLLTYEMSDEFRAQYDATGEVKGFRGLVHRRNFDFGSSSNGENSANIEGTRSSISGGPCDTTVTVPSEGGGSGPGPIGGNNDPDPPNQDDNVITVCESWWEDFDDDESCDGVCVTASQSIFITVCYDYNGSAAESDPCDPNDEVLVIGPDTRCPGNPLKDLQVTSSGASGKKGGTFGNTRSDGIQFHDGLDFTAVPGTPFYAAQSGTVIHVRNSFGYQEYAKDSYGNRVIIRTTLPDGSILDLHYNHLDEVFVQEGQVIDLNTALGNTGKTGNAGDEDVTPHLHIKARLTVNGVTLPKEDSRNNPDLYLDHVTVFDNGQTLQDPCIQ